MAGRRRRESINMNEATTAPTTTITVTKGDGPTEAVSVRPILARECARICKSKAKRAKLLNSPQAKTPRFSIPSRRSHMLTCLLPPMPSSSRRLSWLSILKKSAPPPKYVAIASYSHPRSNRDITKIRIAINKFSFCNHCLCGIWESKSPLDLKNIGPTESYV